MCLILTETTSFDDYIKAKFMKYIYCRHETTSFNNNVND